MSRGRFISVVGPSGVGKDTVMAALPDSVFALERVRRVITRPSTAGGEVFDGVEDIEFEKMEAAGAFALSWRAHGLAYGVPAEVKADLQNGQDLLVNLSRDVLKAAAAQFQPFLVLSLTANHEVLAQRLAARSRESSAEIAARLKRSKTVPAGLDVIEIDNSGALDDTVFAARSALYPESATRCS